MSTGASEPRLRVLVVDDEFLIADYIAMVSDEAGHEVLGPVGSAADVLARPTYLTLG